MRMAWTEEETNYMSRRYIYQSVERTAECLNRSVVSVKRKAATMGLNHYTDKLTAKNIANCFNSDVSVVLRWITKLSLPARKICCNNQTRYFIEAENFWQWAEIHKTEINWSKYELSSILPEPEWVIKEKLSHKQPKNRRKITNQEKILIKNLLRRGKSYKEIAEEVGRSYYSINHISRTIYKN